MALASSIPPALLEPSSPIMPGPAAQGQGGDQVLHASHHRGPRDQAAAAGSSTGKPPCPSTQGGPLSRVGSVGTDEFSRGSKLCSLILMLPPQLLAGVLQS